VPPENRVRRHNRRHLCQDPTAETLPENGQPAAFDIGQPQSLPAQLGLQNPVLCSKIRDGLLLLLLHPANESRHDQMAATSVDEFTSTKRRRGFGYYAHGRAIPTMKHNTSHSLDEAMSSQHPMFPLAERSAHPAKMNL
jgi:hypothetical protein